MKVLVPIVEGDGEVEAVPILLRNLLSQRQVWDIGIARPKNAHGCGNLRKVGGLEKFVELAYREPQCAGVLVLMDADDDGDCPVSRAREFRKRISSYGVRCPVALVFARREYEAWFLASMPSIVNGALGEWPGLPRDLTYDGDVEEVRGVKGWISRQLPRGRVYKETEDQAAMTARLDLKLAEERSRSFRRLVHAVDELLIDIGNSTNGVTPNIV